MAHAGLFMVIAVVSGVLMLPLAYLSAMSGFCMREPGLIEFLTLGLLGDYSICSVLHIEVVPPLLVATAFVHVVSSLEILVYRVKASRDYYMVYTVFRAASWILGAQVLAATIAYMLW